MMSRALVLVLACAAPALAAGPAAGDMQLYQGGLKSAWQYWGWQQPKPPADGAWQLDFSGGHGLILAHPGLAGAWQALTFRVRAPAAFGDFLQVRLRSATDDSFPPLLVAAAEQRLLGDGWMEVRLSMRELNPRAAPFDRIVMQARAQVSHDPVELEAVSLIAAAPGQVLVSREPRKPSRRAAMRVDCRGGGRPISPLIYGIAFRPERLHKDPELWDLKPAARRWGGNNTSRYNPEIGHAWNTASDWYFKNVNYTGDANYSWRDFLAENRAHGVQAAITVPMIGWVAKDIGSYAFPVRTYGPQRGASGDLGSGVDPGGTNLASPPPTATSVAAGPSAMGRWVRAMADEDRRGPGRSIAAYILDNEPMLWNSTHRDVHPDPVTYDELLEKTVALATEIRRNDPQVPIAGPAFWGWPAYFFSALDHKVGFQRKPDRRAHGDVPMTAWYLRRLREHSSRTGVRLLDQLDWHFYPQTNGTFGRQEHTDPAAAALRLRTTRSLWDPTYTDESWINDKIRLLPRMQALIDENYPGLGISIGEYNFGGEGHISGALAQAEALGRFAQFGVTSAYYFTYPGAASLTAQAFAAYRNYDGQGGRFLDQFVPATAADGTSIFASRDPASGAMVLILLNLAADEPRDAEIALSGCPACTPSRIFQLDAQAPKLRELVTAGAHAPGGGSVRATMPPYSLTVIELKSQP